MSQELPELSEYSEYEASEWREGRRLRALELKQQGWSQKAIASALGVTAGAVSQWMKRARQHGWQGLKRQVAAGPEPQLSCEQLSELTGVLEQGAESFGFRGEFWTRARVAQVIQHQFGVTHHPTHVGRLLKGIGWSVQKPVTRADRRDEEAIEEWRDQQWPELKKKAEDEGRTLVCVDEASFSLLPSLVRTWAPCGQTPLLKAPFGWDRLQAISGVTPCGRLLMQVQETSFRGPHLVGFLRHLQRHLGARLLVIWDGLPAHREKSVQKFVQQSEGDVVIEQLPGYAPELNPDEGVWNHLKCHELKNLCCDNLDRLRYELRLAVERLRHKTHLLQACFLQAGLV